MKSDTNLRIVITLIIAISIITIWSIRDTKKTIITTNCAKSDSLQNVINELQTELETQERGFSNKEQLYEDILFEYEYGLDRLKETHPSAYKEFHRIIAFKERYSVEDKIDNQKRLKSYEQLR